jgi:ABC-type sulfate transport system permease component
MSLLTKSPAMASIDLWSAYEPQVVLSSSAGNIDLPSIIIAGLLAWARSVGVFNVVQISDDRKHPNTTSLHSSG